MSGIPDSINQDMDAGGAPPGGAPAPGAGGAPPAAPGATGGGDGGASPFPAMPTGGAFPAMPTGGGGGGEDLPPALAELRNSPQFAQLVARNPASLQQMLPALAQSHPEAALAVQQNP